MEFSKIHNSYGNMNIKQFQHSTNELFNADVANNKSYRKAHLNGQLIMVNVKALVYSDKSFSICCDWNK